MPYFVPGYIDDGYFDDVDPTVAPTSSRAQRGAPTGDVWLFQTDDDGDITDALTLTQGLETAVYLSLFGGNEDDDGTPGNRAAWWANADTDEPDERQVSRLQNLLAGVPPSSANLKRLNDAAAADLAWLDGVAVSSSIPALNRVQLTIDIEGVTFDITEDWAIA